MNLFKPALYFISFFILMPPLVFADFGSHFLMNHRMATTLDQQDKKISFRFTCLKDMNLLGASFYCEQAQNPPAYLMGIHEDKKGEPATEALGTSSVTPKSGSWTTVIFNNVPLYSGKVYHLVIEQNVKRGSEHPVGIIGPNNFASIGYGDLLNPFNPRMEEPDNRLNVLVFENGKWKTLDRQPLYALHTSGWTFQGNPYDDTGIRPICGSGKTNDHTHDLIQGEGLHPKCGIAAKGFAARIRKQGNPTAALQYRIYAIDHMRHKTQLTFEGEALQPGQTSSAFQWVTFGTRDRLPRFETNCSYVVFQTDSGRAVPGTPGCEDCYLLSDVGNSGGLVEADSLSFDGGAHLSRAVFSLDGWATWIDDFERDANIVILGEPCSSTPPEIFPPIPTAVPLLRSIRP